MTDKLNQIYSGLRDYMAASLRVNRTVLDHPGSKGEGAELHWQGFFSEHLPQRYNVANGFVVDCLGEVSEQLDLIVYDAQYTPRLYNLNGQIFVPAESVYATLEVKQHIDKAMLEYAGKKALSVRRLARTSASITHAGGVFEPRQPFRIVAGIVALESAWSPVFGETMLRVLRGLPDDERIDLGCAAAHGGFEVGYSEEGEVSLTVSTAEHSLVFFLFSFLRRLQGLGTAPAVDYARYLETVQLRD